MVEMVIHNRLVILISIVNGGGGKDTILKILTEGWLPLMQQLVTSSVFLIDTWAELFIRAVHKARKSLDCRICKDGFKDLSVSGRVFCVGGFSLWGG